MKNKKIIKRMEICTIYGNSRASEVYEYNNKSQVIRYSTEGCYIDKTHLYEYDEDDRIIKNTIEDSFGDIIVEDYTYDYEEGEDEIYHAITIKIKDDIVMDIYVDEEYEGYMVRHRQLYPSSTLCAISRHNEDGVICHKIDMNIDSKFIHDEIYYKHSHFNNSRGEDISVVSYTNQSGPDNSLYCREVWMEPDKHGNIIRSKIKLVTDAGIYITMKEASYEYNENGDITKGTSSVLLSDSEPPVGNSPLSYTVSYNDNGDIIEYDAIIGTKITKSFKYEYYEDGEAEAPSGIYEGNYWGGNFTIPVVEYDRTLTTSVTKLDGNLTNLLAMY